MARWPAAGGPAPPVAAPRGSRAAPRRAPAVEAKRTITRPQWRAAREVSRGEVRISPIVISRFAASW